MADPRAPARHFGRDEFGDQYPTTKQGGLTASQILAVVALLPVGGTLLALAGIIFVGSLIGLCVATPIFVICSPVIVPAIATIGLAVTGFLSSGAFGLTGLSSLSWLVNYFRQARESMPDPIEQAKKQAQSIAGYAGQKTKDVGHAIQSKAQEAGGRT